MARAIFFAAVGVLALFLSGCSALLVGTVAGGAVYLMQERSAGSAVDDFTIWAGVKNRMLQYGGRNFVDVNVDVVDGRIMLTGMVDSPKLRLVAAKIAWEQPGIKEVINEVQLYDTSKYSTVYASDLSLGTQIRAKLLMTKNIRSINYNIESVGGVIYLLGTAYDREELESVTDIASRVKGVKRVVAHVKMRRDSRSKIVSTTKQGIDFEDEIKIDEDLENLWD